MIPSLPPPSLCVSAGEFPWADTVAGAGAAATRHYAQRYRQLQAQLDRSLEERPLLLNEVIRTFNWLEEKQIDIQALAAVLRQEAAGGGSGGGAGVVVGADGSSSNAGSSGSAEQGIAEGVGSSTGGGRTWSQLLADGQAAQLLVQLQRIQLIHDEACKLLTKYLPANL